MALALTPENFRAEMSRHMLTRGVICDLIGMNRNQFTNFVNGNTPLTDWAAHNIGYGINLATDMRLFAVDPTLGLLSAPRGRPSRRGPVGYGLDPYIRPKSRRRRYNR